MTSQPRHARAACTLLLRSLSSLLGCCACGLEPAWFCHRITRGRLRTRRVHVPGRGCRTGTMSPRAEAAPSACTRPPASGSPATAAEERRAARRCAGHRRRRQKKLSARTIEFFGPSSVHQPFQLKKKEKILRTSLNYYRSSDLAPYTQNQVFRVLNS